MKTYDVSRWTTANEVDLGHLVNCRSFSTNTTDGQRLDILRSQLSQEEYLQRYRTSHSTLKPGFNRIQLFTGRGMLWPLSMTANATSSLFSLLCCAKIFSLTATNLSRKSLKYPVARTIRRRRRIVYESGNQDHQNSPHCVLDKVEIVRDMWHKILVNGSLNGEYQFRQQ